MLVRGKTAHGVARGCLTYRRRRSATSTSRSCPRTEPLTAQPGSHEHSQGLAHAGTGDGADDGVRPRVRTLCFLGVSCSLTPKCCRVTPDSKSLRGLTDLSWKDRDIEHRTQPRPLVGPSDQVLARLLPAVRPDLTTDSIAPLTADTESASVGALAEGGGGPGCAPGVSVDEPAPRGGL